MQRRSFLATTAMTGLMVAAGLRPAAAAGGIVSVAVVITDIDEATDPGLVMQVADGLLRRGVWLTLALTLPEDEGRDGRLAQTLAALRGLGAGVDFAVALPGLARMSPYFQSRLVYETRRRLTRLGDTVGVPLAFGAVLCEPAETMSDPMGVRASGFRNVLVRPETDRPVSSEAWSNGVVRFFGGDLLEPGKSFRLGAGASGGEGARIVYLSARTLQAAPEGQLTAWVAQLAATLAEAETNGQAALLTVADLQLRDDYQRERLLAVVLDRAGDAASAEALSAFRQQLERAGVIWTEKEQGAAFWAEARGTGPLAALALRCEAGQPVALAASRRVGNGIGVRLVASERETGGMDGCAVLNLPALRPGAGGGRDRAAGTGGDAAYLVSGADVATPAASRRVLAELNALRQDGVTRLATVAELAAVLATDGPVETRHRLTRTALANARFAAPAVLSDGGRAALIDDARHAWAYFETYSNAITGLCPATVDSRPGGDLHQAVTMWDVGSNINALVAATELGFIDKAAAEKRMKRILPNIAGRETDGRLLPQGWIRTDRHRWGNRDFDGCDAGRLTAALDNFRRRVGMAGALEKHVAGWDLDKIVLDGAIHSVTERKLISTYGSHCAHYSALAFRRWGLNVASPYETFAGREPGDAEIAMLEAVAGIGPLGAEPLLLEAVELGHSPESRYLTDVLLSAQEEEFAASGRMICASETPIDRSPWFIYQGLQLGAGPRSWRLDTVGHEPQYLTKAAADEYLSFSTKAAYLWNAVRPGGYSERLLSFARDNTRNRVGYASSVSLKTLRATTGYTDLNTNAIILQAIAHSLRKGG